VDDVVGGGLEVTIERGKHIFPDPDLEDGTKADTDALPPSRNINLAKTENFISFLS